MDLSQSEEWQKAQRGELYRAFVPELVAARDRCNTACNKFNNTSDTSRRNLVKLWREITCDTRPLPPTPPPAATATTQSTTEQPPNPANTDNRNSKNHETKDNNNNEDDKLLASEPWIMAPLHADYGINIDISPNTFVNFNSTFVDTCPIKIGTRTLIGPNCSFYSGTHPVDPAIRMGMEGPETGSPIIIGDDCWLGGNVVVLPGVTIGRGTTIGAGSVVVKNIPEFVVAAGNPCRVLRKIDTSLARGQSTSNLVDSSSSAAVVSVETANGKGPEETLARDADKVQARLG